MSLESGPVRRAPRVEAPPVDPEKIEDITTRIDFILDHHEPLREVWEKKIEGLQPEIQLEQLEDLASKRRELMAPTPYVSEHLHVTNEIPPEAEVFFSEQFQKLFEGTQEVGRGYNGRVVEYVTKEGDSEPQGNKIVFKVLMRSPIGHQNDLLSEASYLADLYAIADKYHGPEIGVPRPHYCASLTNARVIAMDKVPGASVEKILTEGIPLPDGYDINLLEEKLLSFVEHMHREGFHHNDLRTGNIMVDLEREDNEKPLGYVIDTGNAKHITQKQIAGDNLDNTLDHVMVRQVIRSLRVYQEEQIKKASQ